MKKSCYSFLVLLTVTFLLHPRLNAHLYKSYEKPSSKESPEETLIKERSPAHLMREIQRNSQTGYTVAREEVRSFFSREIASDLAVQNQGKVHHAQLAARKEDLLAAKDKEQRTPDVSRGIGGIATGHTVEAIKLNYGESYSNLVHSFFETAGKVEGMEGHPDSKAQYPSYYKEIEPNEKTNWAQGGVAAVPQDLEVEIDVVKEVYVSGRYLIRPVVDGDILTRNNNYKVIFRCNMRCYMYIAQLDSTGKMDPIFPSRYFARGNPVEPHTVYSLPPENKWFYLDENTGVETIYFIASRSKRLDLEQLFSKFADRNRSLVQQNPVSLDSAVVITRGIGGVREGGKKTVNFQDGSQGQFASTLFSSIQADFVMTRWFYHQ